MKNIVLVGAFPEDISFIRGGVQASVYGLARALAAREDIASVRVMALPVKGSKNPASSRIVNGIQVIYLKPHRLLAMDALHLPKALRTILNTGDCVVHVHGTGLLQTLLLFSLNLWNIPCVWTLHGITAKETWQRYHNHQTFPALARHFLYRLLEWFSIRVSSHIIVDTPYVQKELHLRNAYTSVIPQGISPEEFANLQHIQRINPVILGIGVITPRKGHHLTLEAFAKVHAQLPQSRLIIAGSINDTCYHQQLQEQIKRLNLSASVELLTDIPRSKILQLLTEARLFALHSEEESQGIALCEALAAGLPVVATHVGGIPYVVTDQQDGILVEYGNTEGFAAALLSLLEDTTRYEHMATAARTSLHRFDWKNIAGEVMNIYTKT